MSATSYGGISLITGSNHATLAPVTLASGEQLTFNHNTGRRAFSVIVTSSDGQVLTGNDGLFVSQPTTNSVVVANTGRVSATIYVSVRWEEPTVELDLVTPGSGKIVIEEGPTPPPLVCPADFTFAQATNVFTAQFINLPDDAAVAAFAANNYDAVDCPGFGSLIIGGAVTSLAGLSSLRVVRGNFSINASNLTSLAGLENLRRVESGGESGQGLLSINGNYTGTLTDITALQGLRFLESFRLTACLGVTELDLSCCNIALVFDGFNADFRIVDNFNLTLVKGLSGVQNAGKVEVTGNTALTNMTGWLPNMTSVFTAIDLAGNGLVTTAGVFPSLQSSAMNIYSNPALTTIAFPSLTSCGILSIFDNNVLIDVGGAGGGAGLSNVVGSTCNNFTIQNNPILPTNAQATALKNIYVSTGFVGAFVISGNGPG